ncbi:MAG: FecR domain-containing protein [Pseudomonadota bacterium]
MRNYRKDRAKDRAGKETERELHKQALALVDAVYERESQENLEALDGWRQQSSRHEQAVSTALLLRSTLEKLPSESSQPSESRRLKIGLWWMRTERLQAPVFASITVLVLVSGLIWSSNSSNPADPLVKESRNHITSPVVTQNYNSAYRKQAETLLPDGSKLWLSWSSEVEIEFSDTLRRVSLKRGSAGFSVVSDEDRPFVVQAGQVTTTVTGTEFVVQLRPAGFDARVSVGVIEGSVRVAEPSNQTVRLSADESVSIADGTFGEVRQQTTGEIGAWRDGLLIFRQRPLIDALRALEPYSSYRFDTTRLWDTERTVSGTFFIDQADGAMLSILEAQQLETQLVDTNTLILRHRPLSRP